MNRIRGRTVLVTGASAGIGRACARAFAERKARLVLLARQRDRLEALSGDLGDAHGVPIRHFALDVRDRSAVETLADDLRRADFMPDVLVNNAGKARGLDVLQEGDPDDWDEMIDTNVKGLLYVSRAFVPHMVERNRGHVVNIGSIAGRWTYPRGNVYCGTKFAVRGISEGLNMDL
ncbi:MAG TPA: SDR family NAD(P)-dependent oxidoreductase, partial [Longimicrobiales bacterium]|nr:SDR family NAD(P)-dependent oxidoreductase [Longimicrobiales bacterium]